MALPLAIFKPRHILHKSIRRIRSLAIVRVILSFDRLFFFLYSMYRTILSGIVREIVCSTFTLHSSALHSFNALFMHFSCHFPLGISPLQNWHLNRQVATFAAKFQVSVILDPPCLLNADPGSALAPFVRVAKANLATSSTFEVLLDV